MMTRASTKKTAGSTEMVTWMPSRACCDWVCARPPTALAYPKIPSAAPTR